MNSGYFPSLRVLIQGFEVLEKDPKDKTVADQSGRIPHILSKGEL